MLDGRASSWGAASPAQEPRRRLRPHHPRPRVRGRRIQTSRRRGERRAQRGRIRPYLGWQPQERGLRRLEGNSHRSGPRSVQIAQRCLAGRRSWYERGCRHRPQGGPAEMPVSEHARRARERVSHAAEREQRPGPLIGGDVLIGGDTTDQLDVDALGEADGDVDGGPRSARHSEATAGRASWIVEDRCDATVRRALRGTAQVPDLRGARRVTLRRGGCRCEWRSAR